MKIKWDNFKTNIRSQPTYEELKRYTTDYIYWILKGSQPTYEELKQTIPLYNDTIPHRSQPTYEELKLPVPGCHSEKMVKFPAYL